MVVGTSFAKRSAMWMRNFGCFSYTDPSKAMVTSGRLMCCRRTAKATTKYRIKIMLIRLVKINPVKPSKIEIHVTVLMINVSKTDDGGEYFFFLFYW